MGGPRKCAHLDRATIERELANSQNVSAAATALGMSHNALYVHMRRLGVPPPPRKPRPARLPAPVESHAPVAAVIAELEGLREKARLLLRTYGPCPHRMQELLRIEARTRYLRGLLRAALGEGETREMVRRPCAPGALRPAWDAASTFHW